MAQADVEGEKRHTGLPASPQLARHSSVQTTARYNQRGKRTKREAASHPIVERNYEVENRENGTPFDYKRELKNQRRGT